MRVLLDQVCGLGHSEIHLGPVYYLFRVLLPQVTDEDGRVGRRLRGVSFYPGRWDSQLEVDLGS